MYQKPTGNHTSKVSGMEAPEHASMKPAGGGSSKVSGSMSEQKGLTQHHGSVGAMMAKEMDSDPIADTTKIAN